MIISNKTFEGHTYVMGILNVTPDSFSDGGKYVNISDALRQVQKMTDDGADIIDIGGESTRPGYTHISDDEEISRVAPVIEAVKKNFDIPVSCDTYKSAVASQAIRSGADLINDIWGLRYDEKMAEVISKSGASCCLMHNRHDTNYTSFMDNVIEDLSESIKTAHAAGIDDSRIILDPGVGFAKSLEQNLFITSHLEQLDVLGYPLLLGTSRKSMIGLSLDLPVNQRLEGTLVTTVFAVQKKCLFVRVHDVLENKRCIAMTEKLLGTE